MEPAYHLVDNALDVGYFTALQDFLHSASVPWTYAPYKVFDETENHPCNYHMFHNFIAPEHIARGKLDEHLDKVIPAIDILRPATILNIRANMTFQNSDPYRTKGHVDVGYLRDDVPYYTAILYMDTNDGCTIFEELGVQIESVANRMLIFPGDTYHSSTQPTDSKRRIVLNMNFIPSIGTILPPPAEEDRPPETYKEENKEAYYV